MSKCLWVKCGCISLKYVCMCLSVFHILQQSPSHIMCSASIPSAEWHSMRSRDQIDDGWWFCLKLTCLAVWGDVKSDIVSGWNSDQCLTSSVSNWFLLWVDDSIWTPAFPIRYRAAVCPIARSLCSSHCSAPISFLSHTSWIQFCLLLNIFLNYCISFDLLKQHFETCDVSVP